MILSLDNSQLSGRFDPVRFAAGRPTFFRFEIQQLLAKLWRYGGTSVVRGRGRSFVRATQVLFGHILSGLIHQLQGSGVQDGSSSTVVGRFRLVVLVAMDASNPNLTQYNSFGHASFIVLKNLCFRKVGCENVCKQYMSQFTKNK